MKDLIKELSSLHAISGFEYRINEKIRDIFSEYCDEVKIDVLGNVIAVKHSKVKDAKKILIEAHMDEIGLMVKNIDEKGFITFENVGGVDERILPASEVIIHGKKDIKGIIGAKPPHIMSSGEGKKTVKITDMAIDTGFDAETVKNTVSIGDCITFAQEPKELADGQMTGKSLDDRASIAVLIEVMKNLPDSIEAEVYAVASVQEEVGGFGAMTAAFSVYPDMAVAIDVCHGITPDNSYCAYEVGKGTVITCGPNIHPAIFSRLKKTAEDEKIDFQIDVDGGNTGTDAWEMQVIREGIPTGLLSIPLKYMHTFVEALDISDVKATAELSIRFINGLKAEEEWLCF